MEEKNKNEIQKKKIKWINALSSKLKSPHVLIIVILSLLLILCCIRIFQLNNDIKSYKHFLNRSRDQIAAIRDYFKDCYPNYTNTENDLEKVPKALCTQNVNSHLDLRPIEGCEVTDLTYKQFVLDGTPVDIRVLLRLVDTYYYSITLYIDNQEIKDIFLQREEFGERFITSNSGELTFLKVKEDEKTILLGILYVEPGPDSHFYYLEIFNKEGERVFKSDEEVQFTNVISYDEELGEINDNFDLLEGHLAYPPICDPQIAKKEEKNLDAYYNTISSITKTYKIEKGEIIFVKKEVETYRDYCHL